MISEIPFSLTQKKLILTSVLYANCGSVHPLFIGVHIDAKKLKKIAFKRKSEINLMLTSKGRYIDTSPCLVSFYMFRELL